MQVLDSFRVLRVVLGIGALGLALGACSNSTGTQSATRATALQPTAYQATSQSVSPNVRMNLAGRWILNDEFERSCVVQLDDAPIEAGKHKAYATKDCTQAMRHLRGWDVSADASSIRLYGANGRVLGQLMRGEEQRYKGSMALTTEQVVIATLRPI